MELVGNHEKFLKELPFFNEALYLFNQNLNGSEDAE